MAVRRSDPPGRCALPVRGHPGPLALGGVPSTIKYLGEHSDVIDRALGVADVALGADLTYATNNSGNRSAEGVPMMASLADAIRWIRMFGALLNWFIGSA
jgi:hypothetical protein